MKKSLSFYLVKLNRFTGWCLLATLPILYVTGYGITGRYGWISALASAELHSGIHEFFIPCTLCFFAVHSCINVYFAAKRWRRR